MENDSRPYTLDDFSMQMEDLRNSELVAEERKIREIRTHIPYSFSLISDTVKVRMDKEVLMSLSDRNLYGEACYAQNEILLNTNVDNRMVPIDKMMQAFYHEKVHFILDAMSEHDLRKNEKFVDLFSRLLLQTDMTAVYER